MALDKEIADACLELLGGTKAKIEDMEPETAKHLDDAMRSIRLAAQIQPTGEDAQAAALKAYFGDNVQKMMPSGPPAPSIHTLYPFMKGKNRR